MPIDLTLRQSLIATMIAQNPWTVTVYRRGRTSDDAATSFTFTGRICPADGRAPRQGLWERGEEMTSLYTSVLVAPSSTPEIKIGDEITAIETASGITRQFVARFPRHVGAKWEVLLDERA